MRYIGLFLAIGIGVCLIGAPGLQAEEEQEETLALGDLPAAVQETLRGHREGVEPDEVEREESKGFVFYEAEYAEGEVKHEIKVDEEGRIVEIEEEIPVSSLPIKALESVQAAYPGAEIEEVELKTLIHYVIEVKEGDEEREIRILENGYLLSSGSEEEDDEAEDDDEGEDEEESEIGWRDLPDAVKEAVKGHRKGVRASGFEKEKEGGHVFYEAEYAEEDGIEHEIKIDETGQIVEIEDEMPVSRCPPALLEKVKSLHPDATIEEVELKRSTYYVVEVEKDDEETEVKLLANGLILGVEDDD